MSVCYMRVLLLDFEIFGHFSGKALRRTVIRGCRTLHFQPCHQKKLQYVVF
jgi:hypothetical protein